ncbi:MAG TPA: KaiC domain-containing protein [Methylothermaceae bacterium]|nr:KaiC domain-containing protein [Methylothermaceae bacterium]
MKDLASAAPELFGIPTGTRLDELFYRVEYDARQDRYLRKTLGGLPSYGVLQVTGIADTGKSLLAEQFALTQTSLGYKVVFVTSESPAAFLYPVFKERSHLMHVDFARVEANLVIVDVSQNFELRDNLALFLDTLRYAIDRKHATVTVIDSVTAFYEHREMTARTIVRGIYNFLKQARQTALLISQKRTSQGGETAEAAGGLAVPHILDGTIVMHKRLLVRPSEARLYRKPVGSVLRTLRIDGCRLTPHDDRIWVFEIDERGLIELVSPLNDYLQGGG